MIRVKLKAAHELAIGQDVRCNAWLAIFARRALVDQKRVDTKGPFPRVLSIDQFLATDD